MNKEAIKEKFQAILRRLKSLTSPAGSIFAIDIGTSAIKIVSLKKFGATPVIGTIDLLEFNPHEIPVDEEQKRQYLSHILKSRLELLKIKNAFSAVSVSGSSVIVREARLPALPAHELRRTLAFEAEPFVPFDIKEVSLDYHILGEIMDEGQKKYETVLIAAKKDLIESRLAVLTGAGTKPAIVDVDALALVNLFSLLPTAAQETAVLCNIGSTVTNLVVIEKGLPRVVRDVVLAGNAFTRALQNGMNLDPAAAEKAKRETGILSEEERAKLESAGDQSQNLQVSQILTNVATDLAGEVTKSTEFFLTHGTERTIQKIYLTGAGALLKNLTAVFSGILKIPVEILNPLSLMTLPSNSWVKAEQGPAFSVACGLALRRWNDWENR